MTHRTQLTLYTSRGKATAVVRVARVGDQSFTLSHQQNQLARKRAKLGKRNDWIGGVDRHGQKWILLGVRPSERSGC